MMMQGVLKEFKIWTRHILDENIRKISVFLGKLKVSFWQHIPWVPIDILSSMLLFSISLIFAEHQQMEKKQRKRKIRTRKKKERKHDLKKLSLEVMMKMWKVVDGNKLKVELMLLWYVCLLLLFYWQKLKYIFNLLFTKKLVDEINKWTNKQNDIHNSTNKLK